MRRIESFGPGAALVFIAACSSSAPPAASEPDAPPVEVVVDVPPPPKPPRDLAVNAGVVAVQIGDVEAKLREAPDAPESPVFRRVALASPEKLGACLEETRDAARTSFLARVDAGARVTVVRERESKAPAGFSACIARALQDAPEVTSLGQVALSVDVHARLAALPCEGPYCEDAEVTGEDTSASGSSGLGLIGVGAGGWGEGTAIGTIGTIGHGSGTGTGQGFGSGSGRLGGSGRAKPPKVRMGATSVSGRLPPEIIQRIVRQNFGRFRLCYENGLKSDPKLEGLVSVWFEIGKDGSVSKVKSTDKTDLKDKGVVACVVKAFSGLSFPQPEGGVVTVSYPIRFSPGEEEKPPTVGGKAIAALGAKDIVAALTKDGWTTALIEADGGKDFVVFADKDGALAFVTKRKGTVAHRTDLRVEDGGYSLVGDFVVDGPPSLRALLDD